MPDKRGIPGEAKASYSQYGMVSTASSEATRAGVKMLKKGGNAVDAAVAAAFCLGVTEPQASGIGGQSMVLLHLAGEGRTLALDGSSRAPFAVDPLGLPPRPLRDGIRATTVPSTPATLGYVLEKYGTLPLGEVLEPAITAAGRGYIITSLQHRLLNREKEKLQQDPLAAENFFIGDRVMQSGEIARQPELARCLERMARAGWRDFYQGEVAQGIVRDMGARGGLISQADLARVPLPVERPALEGTYRGYRLATFPPPGAGRALIQILNILENFSPPELQLETPRGAVIMALAFRHTLKDRERLPVDPTLYLQMTQKLMLDKGYAGEIFRRIQAYISTNLGDYPAVSPGLPPCSGETTHLSAADARGNLVGITQSIESVFGSKAMAQGLGFFYNNYMSAFNYQDMTHPYYLLPGALPYSNVAPTLVFQGGKPFLLLGSPGSERISTSLAQVITRVIDARQDLAAAVSGPRLHASARGRVQMELKRFPPDTPGALARAGFQVVKRGAYSFFLGCVQAVMPPAAPGENFTGASDPRRDGCASGPEYIKGGAKCEDRHHL